MTMSFPKTERQAECMALADRLAVSLASRAATYDRENAFPFEDFADLRASGYLALTVPKRYGGFEADPLETVLAQERLARGAGATALMVTMHLALIGRLRDNGAWPEPVFEQICRRVVSEGALINTIHSEPDMGSPSRGALPSTTLTRTTDGWVLNGRKSWASLIPGLTYLGLLVTIDDGEQPPRRGNILLTADQPGITIIKTWDTLGMRATSSHDVVFDNVLLPPDIQFLGESGVKPELIGGWSLLGPAVFHGIASAARDEAIRWAKERVPNGMEKSIAELQTVQHKVAEMELSHWLASKALLDTAEKWVTEPAERPYMDWELAAAKYTVAHNAIDVTDRALKVVGAAGLSKTLPLERYFRDVRAALNQPPMDDVALTLIGKTALGLVGKHAPRS